MPRSHKSIAEAHSPDLSKTPRKQKPLTLEEVRLKLTLSDELVAEARAETRDMRDKWKAGLLNHRYGK